MTVNAVRSMQVYTVMCCGESAGQSRKFRRVSTLMANRSFPKVTFFEYWIRY